ncbi:MAG: hypothetical protein NTZ90_12275 [Proteobacteria bacterium]|nr:hypothetical protein [Pseudomonadota bacterium]
MKQIVAISYGTSRRSREEVITVDGQDFRLTQTGADFDGKVFSRLIKQASGQCDAIAASFLPQTVRIGRHVMRPQILDLVDEWAGDTPVCCGFQLRSELINWKFQHALTHGQLDLKKARVLMMSGLAQYDFAQLLASRAASLQCLDPWTVQRIPLVLNGIKGLNRYTLATRSILVKSRIGRPDQSVFGFPVHGQFLRQVLRDVDVIASPAVMLESYDLSQFKNKVLLIDYLSDDLAERLRKAGVANCFALQTPLGPAYRALSFSVTEAIIGLLHDAPGALSSEDVLEFLNEKKVSPDLTQLYPGVGAAPRRFAFIIHPLHRGDLFRHPLLKPLHLLPKSVTRGIERGISSLPGIRYGNISGIVSEANGVHAEGLIYTLFATPKEMKRASPETTYGKLVAIAQHAKDQGAEIIGLGAFTKIVGDGGVTVESRSPIPVTTGNSLSAAATLWAAREASVRLGLVDTPKQAGERIHGRCMIIGATGSIGKACAKVLVNLFDEIIVAAPNAARLLNLQEELSEMSPQTKVRVTTQPDRFAPIADVIIISTSAIEGNVLSIDRIKPGCVVCDVSRPLTYSAVQATTRPDILIVESGEIELPGQVKVSSDIGLPHPIVYACLAETALLALEGRFESFTLSRNIYYKKVKEIYKIARKHGARLAAIRSPTGLITEQEINLCREHAVEALRTWGKRVQSD